MRRVIKKMLREAYEVPAPVRKKAFLKQYRHRPETSMFIFIVTQISYIRKRVWLLWSIVFLTALFAGTFMEKDILWIFSALAPLLAVSAVTEHTRSLDCGMAELEMSACFSLESVLFARMAIMAPVHCGLLTLLIWTGKSAAFTLWQSGLHILLPYLLTTVSCLVLTRKIRSRESAYLCMGVAVLIAVIQDAARFAEKKVYGQQNLEWWLAALALLTVLAVGEYRKMFHQIKELA